MMLGRFWLLKRMGGRFGDLPGGGMDYGRVGFEARVSWRLAMGNLRYQRLISRTRFILVIDANHRICFLSCGRKLVTASAEDEVKIGS